MTTALIITAIAISAPLLYLTTLDGNFTVRRSLAIGAPRKAVFDKIRDFRSWPDWSPWLLHEPDTKLAYSDSPDHEGGWYTWDGSTVGAGKLTHEKFTGEEKIEQRIEFARPFKSVSKVWWELEPIDEATTLVHWSMAGKFPFLFRFMTKKISAYVAKDYDTGLFLLRGELEPGVEVLRISFEGPTELPDQNALSIHFEGGLEQMKEAMQEGFARLGKYANKDMQAVTGHPFTIYHKVDLDKMHFKCDMALPAASGTTAEAFEVKSFTGGRYYKTALRGSYEFLELAWYQAYNHLRMRKIRPMSRRAPLEVYENDPSAISDTNELITSIYIPIE